MTTEKHSNRFNAIVDQTWQEYYETIKDMSEDELSQFDNHIKRFRLYSLKKELSILKKFKNEKKRSLSEREKVTEVCNQ